MSAEDIHKDDPAVEEAAKQDILRSSEAGPADHPRRSNPRAWLWSRVVLTAIASVFLLRYLGVVEFGRYVTVLSLIAIVSGVTDAGLTAVGARDLALRPMGEPRERLLANLLGLRLVLTRSVCSAR